jgi:hypothetical protein
MRALWLALSVCSLASCTVGEGEGWVRSDELYMEDCWNGGFDLGPDFFGANPFRNESLLIRLQRGDGIEELSDGLLVTVNELQDQRSRMGEALRVGLPVGVRPPGVPIVYDPDPPQISLALYLHDSCHVQNGVAYSVDGSITFRSLFSGDPNEDESDKRLTEASFDATFADPRSLVGSGEVDPAVQSRVTGYFRFFFQRGQPAQPFQ